MGSGLEGKMDVAKGFIVCFAPPPLSAPSSAVLMASE